VYPQGKEITREDYMREKHTLVLTEDEIYIFEENIRFWEVEPITFNKMSEEDKQKIKSGQYDFKYYKMRNHYPLQDITQITFENGDLPAIEIEFNEYLIFITIIKAFRKVLCMLFADDTSRERFKIYLLKRYRKHLVLFTLIFIYPLGPTTT